MNIPDLTETKEIRKPAKKAITNGIAYALLLGVLAIVGWQLMKVQEAQVDSGSAPNFTFTTFDGETIALSDLRGKVVVMNFWASWCPPCREEAPYLEQTWREYKDKDVIFLGIDYADTEKAALAYIAEFDITYPNGPDLGTRISQTYNMQGVPETFFINKNGELQGVHVGPLKPPYLEQKIEELLAGSPVDNQ